MNSAHFANGIPDPAGFYVCLKTIIFSVYGTAGVPDYSLDPVL